MTTGSLCCVHGTRWSLDEHLSLIFDRASDRTLILKKGGQEILLNEIIPSKCFSIEYWITKHNWFIWADYSGLEVRAVNLLDGRRETPFTLDRNDNEINEFVEDSFNEIGIDSCFIYEKGIAMLNSHAELLWSFVFDTYDYNFSGIEEGLIYFQNEHSGDLTLSIADGKIIEGNNTGR